MRIKKIDDNFSATRWLDSGEESKEYLVNSEAPNETQEDDIFENFFNDVLANKEDRTKQRYVPESHKDDEIFEEFFSQVLS